MRQEDDFSQVRRSPIVPLSPGKTRITIRLYSDIVNWFRDWVSETCGGKYQTMINAALRSYRQRPDELLEETRRRVIREELWGAG